MHTKFPLITLKPPIFLTAIRFYDNALKCPIFAQYFVKKKKIPPFCPYIFNSAPHANVDNMLLDRDLY